MFPSNSKQVAYFPPQQKSDKDKTKEWYKECIDAAIDLAFLHEGPSKHKMQVYEDLDNDIIDEAEIEGVFNCFFWVIYEDVFFRFGFYFFRLKFFDISIVFLNFKKR